MQTSRMATAARAGPAVVLRSSSLRGTMIRAVPVRASRKEISTMCKAVVR